MLSLQSDSLANKLRTMLHLVKYVRNVLWNAQCNTFYIANRSFASCTISFPSSFFCCFVHNMYICTVIKNRKGEEVLTLFILPEVSLEFDSHLYCDFSNLNLK